MALGRRLGIPVFAVDWLLGALTPFGGRHLDGLLDIGAELLTTLALGQLSLGQSAILDHPAEDEATRARWRSLAEWAGARFTAVRCVCTDPAVHRRRVEGRTRGPSARLVGRRWPGPGTESAPGPGHRRRTRRAGMTRRRWRLLLDKVDVEDRPATGVLHVDCEGSDELMAGNVGDLA